MSPSAEPTSENAEVSARLIPADLLGEDEIVILALKPSAWFVLLVSLPVLASAAVAGTAAYIVRLYHEPTPLEAILSLAAAIVLARLMAGCWQWLGRTYVLTNRRIITLRGMINTQVTAAALTDVGQALLVTSWAERVVSSGSVFCLRGRADPQSVRIDQAAMVWNSVPRPQDVHEIVQGAIRRAHMGNHNGPMAGGPD